MTVPVEQRRPNHALRCARTALRMSQAEFAAAIATMGVSLGQPNGCTKRLVQKWESGEHAAARQNYLRALHLVTGLPYERLGFAAPALSEEAAEQRAAAHAASAAMSPHLTGAVSEWLHCALAAPGRVDATMVQLAEATIGPTYTNAQSQPASELLPMVERQVSEVARLLVAARTQPLRRRLAAVGGHFASLAGWLHWTLHGNEGGGARRLWSAASAAAQYCGDGSLMASVLLYSSYDAEWRGDVPGALAFSIRAGELARGGRASAWCSLRSAELAALQGRRLVALRHMESGRAAIAMVGGLSSVGPAIPTVTTSPVDGESDLWAGFYGYSCADATAANVHGLLRNEQPARDAVASALRHAGQQATVARAVALADVSVAAAWYGDTDLAVRVGLQAADLAARLDAGVAKRRLDALVSLLTLYSANKTVAEALLKLPVSALASRNHAC